MKLGFGSESWDDDDDVIPPALFKPHFELPALTNIIEISVRFLKLLLYAFHTVR